MEERSAEPEVARQSSLAARVVPWMLMAVAFGFVAYLYFEAYRPLTAEQAKLHATISEQNATTQAAQREAAQARGELEATRTMLTKTQEELKKLHQDFIRTSEAQTENEKLIERLRKDVAGKGVEVKGEAGAITLTMVDTILFDSGEADIKQGGEALLVKLGRALKDVKGNVIQVSGHTDNVPIKTKRKDLYPTNWELSAARAIKVVRFLQDKVGVDPRQLMPAGFGPYRPVAPNTTPKGRARNRRIEILLLPGGYKVVKGELPEVAAADKGKGPKGRLGKRGRKPR